MDANHSKRIVIVGATSGIGYEVAKIYITKGWLVGLAGRRLENLTELQSLNPQQVFTEQIDVTREDAPENLMRLVEKLGGMDVLFLSSGVGLQNKDLDINIELKTTYTNVDGFVRIVDTAYRFFKKQNRGHIAVISSIAGTKGLGVAPAYSATKRFQNTYIDSLVQLTHITKLDIRFTDIRPGFVRTPLLNDANSYPLMMDPQKVAANIVKGIEKKKRILTIDWRYRILVFFWRMIPQCIWERLSVETKKKTA